MMIYFFSTSRVLKGFTLVDVLMGITLSSVLVLVMTRFVTDVAQYSKYLQQHQHIRKEAFALANITLPQLIREASAIDYGNTSGDQLGLFLDKQEEVSVVIALEEGRLVLQQEDRLRYLHSPQTVIETFVVEASQNPTTNVQLLQEQRSWQPMVRFSISAHYLRPDGFEHRQSLSFFEDPRIAYRTAVTLRNYSFSNLRHS